MGILAMGCTWTPVEASMCMCQQSPSWRKVMQAEREKERGTSGDAQQRIRQRQSSWINFFLNERSK